MSEIKHFGPMHGEKTRRHQFVATDGLQRDDSGTIVSVYECDERIQVELMRGSLDLVAAALNKQEATWLRDALTEWIDAR